jgi:hypothetical protein
MARLSKRRRNINRARHTTAMLLRFEAKVLGVTVSDLKAKKTQQERDRRRKRRSAPKRTYNYEWYTYWKQIDPLTPRFHF